MECRKKSDTRKACDVLLRTAYCFTVYKTAKTLLSIFILPAHLHATKRPTLEVTVRWNVHYYVLSKVAIF